MSVWCTRILSASAPLGTVITSASTSAKQRNRLLVAEAEVDIFDVDSDILIFYSDLMLMTNSHTSGLPFTLTYGLGGILRYTCWSDFTLFK